MRESERFTREADKNAALAETAASVAERDAYLSLANSWRRMAAEAAVLEAREPPP
jgi:hypothetical protein